MPHGLLAVQFKFIGNFLLMWSSAFVCFLTVAKPLLIDDSAKAHALSLAFNTVSLSELTPPLVLQEFINHGM